MIKKKDIQRITRDYQKDFPDWHINEPCTLVRVSGPVLQGICFDRSSRDVYRPASFIRVLTVSKALGVMELPEYLKYPNGAFQREVELSRHSLERDEIVRELHRQMIPSLNQPLVPLEVLELYEQKAIPKGTQAYSIASLCAYMGFESKARQWISRFRALEQEWDNYWLSDPKRKKYHLSKANQINLQSDKDRRNFIDQLENWLDEGNARQHLEEMIRQELQKLKLNP